VTGMLTTKTKLILQIHLRAPVCINQIITPIENLVENIVDQKADNVSSSANPNFQSIASL
jgi:hypothetical protein